MSTKNYKQFTEVSWSGRRLLEKHKLSEHGLWQIRGEDANCDMGGQHHMPDLGIVEGTLKDVIEYAVELPRFWTWGGGGEINKLAPIPKINPETNKERADLKAEAEELERRLWEINKRLLEI